MFVSRIILISILLELSGNTLFAADATVIAQIKYQLSSDTYSATSDGKFQQTKSERKGVRSWKGNKLLKEYLTGGREELPQTTEIAGIDTPGHSIIALLSKNGIYYFLRDELIPVSKELKGQELTSANSVHNIYEAPIEFKTGTWDEFLAGGAIVAQYTEEGKKVAADQAIRALTHSFASGFPFSGAGISFSNLKVFSSSDSKTEIRGTREELTITSTQEYDFYFSMKCTFPSPLDDVVESVGHSIAIVDKWIKPMEGKKEGTIGGSSNKDQEQEVSVVRSSSRDQGRKIPVMRSSESYWDPSLRTRWISFGGAR